MLVFHIYAYTAHVFCEAKSTLHSECRELAAGRHQQGENTLNKKPRLQLCEGKTPRKNASSLLTQIQNSFTHSYPTAHALVFTTSTARTMYT